MARRRLFTGRRRRTNAPPKPINIKPDRIPVEDLRHAYNWLSVDIAEGMLAARRWYANHIPSMLIGRPLTAEEHKSLTRSEKAFSLGDGTTGEAEKEQAYRTAFRLLEKIFTKHDLPTVDQAFTDKESGKAAEDPFVKMALQAVAALNQVYQRSGITYKAAHVDEREFTGDTVLLPIRCLATESLLQTVLAEVMTAAKTMSIVTVGDELQLDGTKLLETIPVLLKNCGEWAEQNSKSLFGKVKVKGGKTISTTPRAPREKRPLPTGVGVVGVTGKKVYRVGTANAAVYDLLADEQMHTLRECYDAALNAGSKYEKDALWYVKTDGKKTGAWDVSTFGKSSVQLIFTKP